MTLIKEDWERVSKLETVFLQQENREIQEDFLRWDKKLPAKIIVQNQLNYDNKRTKIKEL